MSKCTKKCLLFLSFLTGAGVIAGGSNITHALTYQDTVDVQFTFNPTVSINVSGDLIIPNLTPGSALDSNIITVKAGSNDANGYTLYSTVGSSTNNYTDLRTDSSNTTNVFTNLSSSKASLENFDDNTWGYSYCNTTNDCDTNTNWVSGNAGSTAAGYNGLPLYNASNNATGVILANTTSPNETELKFKIGAKAASTQAAGAYTNTINFIGVGKVVTTTYNLNYLDTSSEGTGLPTSLTNQTTNSAVVNLSTATPTRTGYVFKGWCDTNNSSDPTNCSGNTYKPGKIYIIPEADQGSSNTLNINLYAIWEDPSASSILAMQDVATWSSTLNTGDEVTAVDTRDGKSYTVAKLADGNIWMTQNLDFDIDSTETYTSADTDISADWTPSTATYTTNTTTWGDNKSFPESYDPGDLCWNGTLDDNWSGTLDNMTAVCSDNRHYHIGNYYNWTAAVAMNNSSSYTTDEQDVNQSICPAGWRLPTYSGDKSCYNLINGRYTSGTSGTIQSSPVYFVYGGAWISMSRGVGTDGFYWSSVVYDDDYAYELYFDAGGSLLPQYGVDRNYGASVRCVTR